MDLTIRTPDEPELASACELDESFVVESEVVLFAEEGVVRYEVVPVPPCTKRYGRTDGNDLAAFLRDPDRAVFVADLDGSIVGRILLSKGWNRFAWVDDLAVDARHRRTGIGRALIERAVAWAVETGLPGVRLETQSNNVPACRFYESCGFHLGGFDRDLYRGLDPGSSEIALFWYRPLGSTQRQG